MFYSEIRIRQKNKNKTNAHCSCGCELCLTVKFIGGWRAFLQGDWADLVLVQTKGFMQAKYLFSGRLYKGRKSRFVNARERDSVLHHNNRLLLHNSYHSPFPAIDLFPSKVYSCCIINNNTPGRSCTLIIRREKCCINVW